MNVIHVRIQFALTENRVKSQLVIFFTSLLYKLVFARLFQVMVQSPRISLSDEKLWNRIIVQHLRSDPLSVSEFRLNGPISLIHFISTKYKERWITEDALFYAKGDKT